MPRVHYVKQARVSTKRRVCVTCGHDVQRFEAYRYAEPRVGPKLIWCYKHMPKRSQLSSSKLGPLWDMVDEFDATDPSEYPTLDDLKTAIEVIRQTAEEIADEYEDSFGNMPSQEGPIAEQMQENIDQLRDYIDNLDNFDPDGKSDDDMRPDIEIMVVREMLDEDGIDYADAQLTDPISRGQLISEHLDQSVFEAQVNERCEDALNGSLEEARGEAQQLVQDLQV